MISTAREKTAKYFMRVIVFTLVFLSGLACAQVAAPQVSAKIALKEEKVVISLTNISDNDIQVGDISIGDQDYSGLWLFLYDPKSKKNQLATALVEHAIGITKDNYPMKIVGPGQAIEKSFDRKYLLEYFSETNGCFFFTIVYRKQARGSLVFSRASVPLKLC